MRKALAGVTLALALLPGAAFAMGYGTYGAGNYYGYGGQTQMYWCNGYYSYSPCTTYYYYPQETYYYPTSYYYTQPYTYYYDDYYYDEYYYDDYDHCYWSCGSFGYGGNYNWNYNGWI